MVVVGAPRLHRRRVDMTKHEKIKKDGRRRWWHVAAPIVQEKSGLDQRWRDESGGTSSDSFCTTKYDSPDKNTRWKSCWKIEIVRRKKDNELNGTLEIGKRMIEGRQLAKGLTEDSPSSVRDGFSLFPQPDFDAM